ncbi:MAG: RecT family recombinase [Erysipelotrichaceae bacterium]
MTQQPNQTPNNNAPAKNKPTITEYVQSDIDRLIAENAFSIPQDYAVGNAIQSAYLNILTVVDRDKKPALTVCEQSSIVYAIKSMIVQGLNVDKKQGYFIVYGNQLQFQRSYFGTLAVAKRFASVADIIPQVILKGDEVETEIINGEERIIVHKRKRNFDTTISADSIIGAYCIVKLRNGGVRWEIMDKGQIQAAWNKSKNPGQTTHKEFPDQMAKKTVIGRALKLIINSSDDTPLLVKNFIESGYVEGEDDDIPALEETAFTELVDADAMMAEQAPEAPKEAEVKPIRKVELKSESKVEQTTLPVGNPF